MTTWGLLVDFDDSNLLVRLGLCRPRSWTREVLMLGLKTLEHIWICIVYVFDTWQKCGVEVFMQRLKCNFKLCTQLFKVSKLHVYFFIKLYSFFYSSQLAWYLSSLIQDLNLFVHILEQQFGHNFCVSVRKLRCRIQLCVVMFSTLNVRAIEDVG